MNFLKTMMILGLLSMSLSAVAHTGLKTTYPANEQMLEAAPKQLSLVFGAPVRLMKVVLMDAEHKDLKIGFKPSAQANETFKITVPELQLGQYMVSWVSMGKDGHKMSGDFNFMVQSKVAAKPAEGHDEMKNDAHKDDGHAH